MHHRSIAQIRDAGAQKLTLAHRFAFAAVGCDPAA